MVEDLEKTDTDGITMLKQNVNIIRRISARFQYNCAKNGKGLKIGIKEADTT